MATMREFFHQLGHFFPIFEKGQGNLPPSPSNYAPEQAYHIIIFKTCFVYFLYIIFLISF